MGNQKSRPGGAPGGSPAGAHGDGGGQPGAHSGAGGGGSSSAPYAAAPFPGSGGGFSAAPGQQPPGGQPGRADGGGGAVPGSGGRSAYVGLATGSGGAASRPATSSAVAAGGGASSAPRPMPARKATLDDFVLLKTVGKGSFGKVVMVKKKDDDKVYAMKILKKEMVIKRKQYEHTLSERRILENIDHPFIVSLRFAFQTEHRLYMIFDFFNGGELYHYLSEGGRFGEERARFYAAEITSALDYMHSRGIVYRDLKPENLILDGEGHLRITDFGLSKEGVVGDSITSICGTPEYLAPEILRKRPYGAAVDWWSLGTLLYEMIAGLPPFYDRNRQAMYRKILEAPLEPPDWMSPEAADICARLLIREPTARLGYGGAAEIKAHPFFRGLDWAALDARRVPPPWLPDVAGPTDTSNIAHEFTAEPAAVTPSPAQSRLRDAVREAGGASDTPPSFTEFTFTHASVLDGQTYRVSFAEEEGDGGEDDGPALPAAAAAAPGAGSGRPGRDSADGGGGVGVLAGSGGGGGDDAAVGAMGAMEGLRIN